MKLHIPGLISPVLVTPGAPCAFPCCSEDNFPAHLFTSYLFIFVYETHLNPILNSFSRAQSFHLFSSGIFFLEFSAFLLQSGHFPARFPEASESSSPCSITNHSALAVFWGWSSQLLWALAHLLSLVSLFLNHFFFCFFFLSSWNFALPQFSRFAQEKSLDHSRI